MKRFKEGPEEGIYAYGNVMVKEIAQGNYWDQNRLLHKVATRKPWWKFW